MTTIPIWLLVVLIVPYVVVVLWIIIYIIAGVHDLAVAKKIAKQKTECPYKIEDDNEIH